MTDTYNVVESAIDDSRDPDKNWYHTPLKRWYAADEVAREAQEVYDHRVGVEDPYAMHKTLEFVINRLHGVPSKEQTDD